MSASLPPPAADRNLLFGILALQMDFISRDALVAAMNAWVLDKARPLGQILVEQGALPAPKRELLDALVQAHVEAHGNDPARSLATISPADPVRELLQQVADADVQASLGQAATVLKPEEGPAAPPPPPTVGTPTSTGLRFRVLRPHARGGLGEVYVALDQELHREVALKEIQTRYADHAQSRSRFLLEAEVTGRLEHPSIVPVYGLGHYPDGRPFYAMRFIKGDSLQEAVERFHQADTPDRDPGERQLEFRQLLGRFLDVCNAVAYAHSRGVLHRDLKPGNVMLGPYGETLVVDWGLAKVLGHKEGSGESAEATLLPKVSSGSGETVSGSALGTPAYMSPEQAAGRLDELGPASDVYSLGATLYCLLTGRPPVQEPNVQLTLARVQLGEFPRPREIKPAVPLALEAVCLKATALQPNDRYPSPRLLADDLEHWLADEPVSAYRERLPARLGRWVRQHKTLVGSAAAAGAVAATVLIAVLLVTAAQARQRQDQLLREDAEAQRVRAEEQQQLAERNRIEAEQQRDLAERNRTEADRQRGRAERYLYASHLDLAHREWRAGRAGHALELLEEHRLPKPGQGDLRGFEWHYFARLRQRELFTLRHTGGVECVAFSPDGRRLASGGADGTVKVWDSFTGQVPLALPKHAGAVSCVAFSPDGKRLASVDGQTVKLWDAATGQQILTLEGPTDQILSVAFSPDGRRLASSGRDGAVRLWDLAAPQMPLTRKVNGLPVSSVAFSPDGKRLAAGSYDQTVRLWDVVTGGLTLTLQGPPGRLLVTSVSVAFSPDGKRLASSTIDQKVKVWDIVSGRELLTFHGHTSRIRCVAFSPDGRRLASSGNDGTVKLWESATGRELLTLSGHTESVSSVAFSPDGRRLASGSHDKTIRVWETAADQERFAGNPSNCLAFSPDGQRLASADPDWRVRVWDCVSRREVLTLRGHWGGVSSVAFSPDGKRLASRGDDGTVRLWDSTTGQAVFALPGHAQSAGSVAFSPDGNQLASPSDERTVKLWDANTRQELRAFTGHTDVISGVAFSPDGRRLALGSWDGTVTLWDSTTGQRLLRLLGHSNPVTSVAFSPDGRRLASGSWDKSVRLWDAATGRPLLTLKAHPGTVSSVAFSPDGTRLASGSFDQSVVLWDTSIGQELLTLKGHTDVVTSVAFSPDGKRLASGGGDGTVVWDTLPPAPEVLLRRQAKVLVESLFHSLVRRPEVLDQLRKDAGLNEPLRQACLTYAQDYRPDPMDFNNASWRVAARTGATADQYHQALLVAEEACRLKPDHGTLLNTLGVAQYRVGQYPQALATLTRSDQINAAGSNGHLPVDLAFLAMVHHRLGHQDQTQDFLQRLREAMKQDRWARDEEARDFWREAEALLKGD